MTLTPVPAEDETSVELLPARADTDSWVNVVREITLLAQQIAGTTFVPRGLRDSIPATAAAMLYGREIGLPPMTALSQIAVVDGRPSLSAEAMRALVLAAGHSIEFDESTGAICRIRGRRLRSSEWTRVEWTIDHARKAGLLRRGSAWESYPREMLVARATTALCRMVFPDVIHGFRSAEELDDMSAGATPGAAPESSGKTTRVARRRKTAENPEIAPTPTGSSDSPPSTGDPVPAPVRSGPSLPGVPGEGEEPAAPPAPPQGVASVDVPRTGPRHARPARTVEDVDVELPIETPEGEGRGAPAPSPDLVNRVTLKLVFAQLRRLGLNDDREERLGILSRIAGRDLTTSNDLTQPEGSSAILVLSSVRDREQLEEALTSLAVAHELDGEILVEDTEAKPPRGDAS